MRERQQAHALVVCHEGADHDTGGSSRQPGRGVVDRLVHAELTLASLRGEPLQIQARGFGRHHQREHGGVGRDHEVLCEAALEA